MGFADRDILCVGCGATFVFSAGEQQFFQNSDDAEIIVLAHRNGV